MALQTQKSSLPGRMTMRSTGKRTALITFLGALCMLLSAVEYAIPKPVPFMRLGLANLPVLLALYIGLSASEYFLLVALKILTQALVSGTLFSYVFLFSLAGSLSSATVMWLLFKAGRQRGSAFKSGTAQEGNCQSEGSGRGSFSATGICMGGALANNLAQLALSYFLLLGDSTRYVAPVLLITGAVTGVLLGFFAQAFMSRSRWFAAVCAPDVLNIDDALPADNADESGKIAEPALKSVAAEPASESGPAKEGRHQSEGRRAGTIRFCAALAIMIAFLFIKDVRIMAVLTVVFYIAARIRRQRVRILPSLIILATVTVAALLSPAGRVLVRLGSFPITLGALETGLARSLTLVGMVFLSQYATSDTVKLPGKAGVLLESVLNWFSALTAKKLSFAKGAVVKTLDAHLYEIYFSGRN